MSELLKSEGYTHVEVNCYCPYCGYYQDILEHVRESMGFELSAKDIDVEVSCESCDKTFIVDNVEY